MKSNVGSVDRLVRVLVALAIGVAYMMGLISGTLAIVLGVVAVAMIVTGLAGFCPAYLPLGISTCKTEKT